MAAGQVKVPAEDHRHWRLLGLTSFLLDNGKLGRVLEIHPTHLFYGEQTERFRDGQRYAQSHIAGKRARMRSRI